MKKLSLPLIFDTLFILFSSFIFFFAIFRFFLKPLFLIILFSILLSLIATGGIFAYMYFKKNSAFNKKLNSESRNSLSLSLAVNSNEKNSSIFLKYFDFKKLKADLVHGGIFVKEQNAYYFLLFKFEGLTADSLTPIIQKNLEGKITVLCNAYNQQFKKIAETFNIEVLGIDKVYSMLKEADLVESNLINLKKEKLHFIERIKFRFSKKMYKGYFISALMLLVLSYFTFFPLYYVIAGCILLLISVAVRFFGNEAIA